MIAMKDIKDKFPKGYEKLGVFIKTSLGEMQRVMTEGMEGIPPLPEITDEVIEGSIMWNPRMMLDFFDQNRINIGITVDSFGYNYSIGDHSGLFKTRVEAEEAAFKQAFELLETI